jgi:hypothetical protein
MQVAVKSKSGNGREMIACRLDLDQLPWRAQRLLAPVELKNHLCSVIRQ